MASSALGRHTTTLVLTLTCALAAPGCVPGAESRGASHPELTSGSRVEATLADEAFAGAVRDLLVAPPASPERARLLGQVEARQMARAVSRFHSHEAGRGLMAVIGGLYLLRAGELTGDTLGSAGGSALRSAVRELAVRGDEGRARALYDILVRLAPDAPARAEAQAHLDAISAWSNDALRAGPSTVAAGTLESASVARSLLEPSQEARSDAQRATLAWISTAVELQEKFREKRVRPSREEVGEAVRALHAGNDVLAQIFLRDGDAAGAIRALGKSPLSRSSPEVVRTDLANALEGLGAKPSVAQWLVVLHALSPPREREAEEEDGMEDRELVRAAMFGVLLEAYRIDPSEPEPATLLAGALQDLGLAEASPAIVVASARAHADARTVGNALNVVVRAMSLELSASDYDAVRRTYAAAGPLLELASAPALARELRPNAAKVRAMMGDIELEQGAVDAARALLRASAAEERSGYVLLSLARIDRHDGKLKQALDDLHQAHDAADTARDAALAGEILLTSSDIARDLGDAAGVRPPLVDALKVLVRARSDAPVAQRAHVEQVLARVLDRFGARDKAQQALERAFEATPHDKRQIAATLGQVVARALVRRDLPAARDGLNRAIAAELPDEELVYYALWVRLLERQLRRADDKGQASPATRVFAGIPDDGHWVGKLAAFGSGKIPASLLASLAKTRAEKTEATFYQVMDARQQPAGQAEALTSGLRAVLREDGVELMEAAIAREMLMATTPEPPLTLPADVKLP